MSACQKFLKSAIYLSAASLDDMPLLLRQRWAKAHKLRFPVQFEDLWLKIGVPFLDAVALTEIRDDASLWIPGLAPGIVSTKLTKVLIKAVFDKEKDSEREVLLNVRGREYLLQLGIKQTQPAKKIPRRAMREIRWDPVHWDELTQKEKKWLATSEAVGTSIVTSTGNVFTRVADSHLSGLGPSWRDEATGLAWIRIDQLMTQGEARISCKNIGAELPTSQIIEDLIKKEGHLPYLFDSWGIPHSWALEDRPDLDELHFGFNAGGEEYLIFCFSR